MNHPKPICFRKELFILRQSVVKCVNKLAFNLRDSRGLLSSQALANYDGILNPFTKQSICEAVANIDLVALEISVWAVFNEVPFTFAARILQTNGYVSIDALGV